MNRKPEPAPSGADWCGMGAAGALLGLTLALALAGLFAWVGPGGIGAPQKSQFVMWLIAPLWMAVFALVFLLRSGARALLWLGGANLLAYALLFAARALLEGRA